MLFKEPLIVEWKDDETGKTKLKIGGFIPVLLLGWLFIFAIVGAVIVASIIYGLVAPKLSDFTVQVLSGGVLALFGFVFGRRSEKKESIDYDKLADAMVKALRADDERWTEDI
jgi:hypothetical protein